MNKSLSYPAGPKCTFVIWSFSIVPSANFLLVRNPTLVNSLFNPKNHFELMFSWVYSPPIWASSWEFTRPTRHTIIIITPNPAIVYRWPQYCDLNQFKYNCNYRSSAFESPKKHPLSTVEFLLMLGTPLFIRWCVIYSVKKYRNSVSAARDNKLWRVQFYENCK